jgi:hypothetical protein
MRLPTHLEQIYREVVETFNGGSLILCAAGLRALLEGICKDISPGHKGNLSKRIDALASLIPSNIVHNLHSFRFLGNGAVHELARPAKRDLALAIEVIEDILNILYELDYKSDRLYQSVAKNPKR